jgi:hypothetical protein
MIDFTEGSRMRTNASGSPKTQKPNIIPKGQMNNQTPCNHRTPYKPEVQYYDEQMVIVNGLSYTRKEPTPIVIHEDENTIVVGGVKYQKIEDPKPKHLQQIIQECFDDKKNIHTTSDIIDRIEKEWTPLNLNQKENRGFTDGYSMGFDDALNLVRKTLR